MRRGVFRKGIAFLGIAAAVAVVALVMVRFALPAPWPDDAIVVPRDAVDLETALRTAESGATIVLQPGAGDSIGPFVVDTDGLTIVAAGEGVCIVGEGGEPALAIRADGVTVRGVEVSAESIGLQIEASRCRVEDVTVVDTAVGIQFTNARDSELADVSIRGGRVGIELVASGGNRLEAVEIDGSAETGVLILNSWNNRVAASTIRGAPTGLRIDQASSENELTGCRIEGSTEAGVSVHASTGNRIVDCDIDAARIGIELWASAENEMRSCTIDGSTATGVSLRQAVQNRVVENRIADTEGVGIGLVQSEENAICYNRIDASTDEAVALDGSDRNLVMANVLRGNRIGIGTRESSFVRILRNEADGGVAGMVLVGGEGNRAFDNRIERADLGLVASSSIDGILLRNAVGACGIGLALVEGCRGDVVSENALERCDVGLLAAFAAREDFLHNRISDHRIGLYIVHPGAGTRIEGNTIDRNEIGLLQNGAVDLSTGSFAAIGIETGDAGDAGGAPATPVIVNNTFAANREIDILNRTSAVLLAAGNRWEGEDDTHDVSAANVSDGVSLDESAWRGTIAIGTEFGSWPSILGRLLEIVLGDEGFRVIDLIGMGDAARVREAVRLQDVDLVWWGDPSAASSEEGVPFEGGTRTLEIPATRGWLAVGSSRLAERLTEPTLSAVAAHLVETGEAVRYTAPRAFGAEAIQALLDAYGVEEASAAIQWAESIEEAEALLKFGVADVAVVENLMETLTRSGFVALEDDLGVLPSAPLAMIFRDDLVSRYPGLEQVLADLASRLTGLALHELIGRVRMLHLEPTDVARAFLQDGGTRSE